MSGFLFITALRNGIRWNFTTLLEDLEYADDIALLSSKWEHLQEKTFRLQNCAEYFDLNINENKTKVLRINTRNDTAIKVNAAEVENVDEFTYLGATLTKDGGSQTDVKRRIAKARNSFILLNNIWKSNSFSLNTKLKIFQTNVMSVLLYGSSTWKMNVADTKRVDTFQRNCLRFFF